MKIAILAVLLSCSVSHAKTERRCLSELAKKMGYSESKLAHRIMTCNVKLLEGFKLYTYNGKVLDRTIRFLYPSKKDPTSMEKAVRLEDYNTCEYVSALLATYMRECGK